MTHMVGLFALGATGLVYWFTLFEGLQLFWIFLGAFSLSSVILSVVFSRKLSRPIGRIIAKAISLTSRKQARILLGDDPQEELFLEDGEEYFELEQALDRISRKLLKRRTQLAHGREEAQALMSYMNDGVISVNREEKVVFFNSYFGAQFIEPSLLKLNQNGNPLFLSDLFRDPQMIEGVRSILNLGGILQFQKKFPTKLDPSGRHFSITITPLREEKGGGPIYGALLILHDFTEIKTTELLKSEFVENASHELRTPLTNLKGYVTAAIEDFQEGRMEQIPQFLGVISRNVQRLSELVHDLLTLSALENRPSIKTELVSPEQVTNTVLEQVAKQASDRKIMLQALFESREFPGDHTLVERVLANLISNAIKYCPEGSVVRVQWTDDPEKGRVLLSVKDNGQGIAEEYLGRLFERFYRVDKGRSRDVGGTGLGLAIVKHIMQTHGGTVGVRSSIGQGTEFICSFPRGLNGKDRSLPSVGSPTAPLN
jgi:two-component system phosphate regulon sensor histidine kinase PhoR